MVYFVERSLESIEERTTESEESDDDESVREKKDKEEAASKMAKGCKKEQVRQYLGFVHCWASRHSQGFEDKIWGVPLVCLGSR